jgi:hypothetical protein
LNDRFLTELKGASPAVFTRLFNAVFRGKLRELCQDPVANFVVQRLMPACNGPQQLELVLAEVVPLFPDLYKTRPGVLRSAVDACVKLDCGYKGVVKGLRDAVKIQSRDDDPSFGNVYIRLQTLEVSLLLLLLLRMLKRFFYLRLTCRNINHMQSLVSTCKAR